jgi:C-terminal processing protease CtpA/Prc
LKATPWISFGVSLLLALAVLVGPGCGSSWKGSIGAVLGKDNRTGRVYVRDAPVDMAAARAGLEVDDEVLAIDGKAVLGMSPDEVHQALNGNVGSKVTLTVARGRTAKRDVVVERGPLRGEEKPPQK